MLPLLIALAAAAPAAQHADPSDAFWARLPALQEVFSDPSRFYSPPAGWATGVPYDLRVYVVRPDADAEFGAAVGGALLPLLGPGAAVGDYADLPWQASGGWYALDGGLALGTADMLHAGNFDLAHFDPASVWCPLAVGAAFGDDGLRLALDYRLVPEEELRRRGAYGQPVATPEPAAWALLAGFAGVALLLRRRQGLAA